MKAEQNRQIATKLTADLELSIVDDMDSESLLIQLSRDVWHALKKKLKELAKQEKSLKNTNGYVSPVAVASGS